MIRVIFLSFISFKFNSVVILLRVSIVFMVIRFRLYSGSYVRLDCLSMKEVFLLVNMCISEENVCIRWFRVVFVIVFLVGLGTALVFDVFVYFDTFLMFCVSAHFGIYCFLLVPVRVRWFNFK